MYQSVQPEDLTDFDYPDAMELVQTVNDTMKDQGHDSTDFLVTANENSIEIEWGDF